MTKRTLLTLMSCMLLACAPLAMAQDQPVSAPDLSTTTQQCKFVSISVNNSETQPTGINDFGTIVGTYFPQGGFAGFVLKDGKITTVRFPGAIDTVVYGRSDTGVVVGDYDPDQNAHRHGFALANGKFVAINFPGSRQTEARGIIVMAHNRDLYRKHRTGFASESTR